jgi:hypothetical protein
MAKKAKKEVRVLVMWNSDEWGKELSAAKDLVVKCGRASDNLVDAILQRAKKFVDLETHAKKNKQTERLPDIYDSFGSPDAFTKTLWRAIGAAVANDSLSKHKANIPASQESIKALARHHDRIDELVAKKNLSRESSVSDVRKMLGEPQANSKQRENEARLIATAEGVGSAVIGVLKSSAKVRVALRDEDQSVYDFVAQKVNLKTLSGYGGRLVLGTKIPHNPLAEWDRKNGKAMEKLEAQWKPLNPLQRTKNQSLAKRIQKLANGRTIASNALEDQLKLAGIATLPLP